MKAAIFSLALCFLASLQAGAPDRSTPEATVRSFLMAFERGDVKQAAACVKGAQLSDAGLEALAEQVKKDPAFLTLRDAKTTLNGTTAAVTGKVTVKGGKARQEETLDTVLSLVLSGGTWQIVPDASRARQDTPDLVNALAYALTDEKVFTHARDAARATSCLSNVKQICLGALMFSQDYDEVFKFKADTYKKSLMPYIKNETIFKCPSDSSGATSYSFNEKIAGLSLAKIPKPAETVMIYEGQGGKLNFRHDGKATVGFVDGHVKQLHAQGAKTLRWKP